MNEITIYSENGNFRDYNIINETFYIYIIRVRMAQTYLRLYNIYVYQVLWSSGEIGETHDT